MPYQFDFNNDRPDQGLELQAFAIDVKHDPICYPLAKYLADGLNYDLYQRECKQAVSNILDYDGLTVDNSQFPLLKVYRLTDNHKGDTALRNSNMVVTYSLIAPQQQELPGILNWLSVSINHLLDYYHFNHQHCEWNVELGDRTAEYKIMLNEINNFAFPFFRIPFSVIDQSR